MELHAIALLAEKIRAIGSDEFMIRLCDRMADQALEEIDKCFRDERDPYGKDWPSLTWREPARGSILQLTGDLRRSWKKSEVSQHGFTVESTSEYAVHHQYGAPAINMPARPMVPLATKGLGLFRDPLEKAATKMLSEELA